MKSVELQTILACIWEVRGSSLDPDTDYRDWNLSLFFSVSSGKFWDITLN
jgi:hypothetical protein